MRRKIWDHFRIGAVSILLAGALLAVGCSKQEGSGREGVQPSNTPAPPETEVPIPSISPSAEPADTSKPSEEAKETAEPSGMTPELSGMTPEPTVKPAPKSWVKMACLGDSITDWGGIWIDVVQGKLSFEEMYNLGIAQSTIADTDKDPFYARYQSIPADSDLIFVFGGTNDFYQNIPLGAADSVNPGEFCGALNVLCTGLRQDYPDALLVFATPIQRTSAYGPGPNEAGLMLADYGEAMKAVCGGYGIPVIDLYNGSGITADNADSYLEDGLHPNAEGYQLLGEVIAAELKRWVK